MTIAAEPIFLPAEQLPLEPLVRSGTLGARRVSIALYALLILMYALLQNPYWIRYGDSEVFLSMARSLARGQGYRFGGNPVGIIPPVWPYTLAAAMKITTLLPLLKLLPMFCILGFLFLSHRILLRFATPLVAALCVLIAALIQPVSWLSYLFFSDAPFALMGMLALWLALQIGEGKDDWPRIILLAALCVISIGIRWAGILWFPLIGGALLSGELLPRFNRRWISAVACGVLTLAAFFIIRHHIRAAVGLIDPRYDSFLSSTYDIVTSNDKWEYLQRASVFGQWIAGLFWPQIVAARDTRFAANIAGWMCVIPLCVTLWKMISRRQWMWLGAAIYLVALAANWPNPMPRYIVPLAPLLAFGIFNGIETIGDHLRGKWKALRTLAIHGFVATVLVLNGAVFAFDIVTMRTRDFYRRYESGLQKELIDGCAFLNNQPNTINKADYEVAVSCLVIRHTQHIYSDGFRRAVVFLADRPVISVPEELCREPDAELIAWLKSRNVRYYFYQPPFAVVRQGPDQVTMPTTREDIVWRLYEIVGDSAKRVTVPSMPSWPTGVPGM